MPTLHEAPLLGRQHFKRGDKIFQNYSDLGAYWLVEPDQKHYLHKSFKEAGNGPYSFQPRELNLSQSAFEHECEQE